MTIASTILKSALRSIGQLGEGETPTPQMYSDALTALNQFIDDLANSPLTIYSTQKQTFTWPASTASRTLGPTGDFVGVAPVALDESTHFVDPNGNITYAISLIPEVEYQLIPFKSNTATYPSRLWANYTEPDITMTVYPIPSVPLTFNAISMLELTQPAAITTNLVVPAGYDRFFKYNLAVEVATEFGIEPPPTIRRIAQSAMRRLKRTNKADLTMRLPDTVRRESRSRITEGV